MKHLVTKAHPNGRQWPNEIVLDVGSSMPYDVYMVADMAAGVRYVRHDLTIVGKDPNKAARLNHLLDVATVWLERAERRTAPGNHVGATEAFEQVRMALETLKQELP